MHERWEMLKREGSHGSRKFARIVERARLFLDAGISKISKISGPGKFVNQTSPKTARKPGRFELSTAVVVVVAAASQFPSVIIILPSINLWSYKSPGETCSEQIKARGK